MKTQASIIDRIEKAAHLQFSDEQVKVIESYGRPTSVIACAGSGKTTTMIAKLFYIEDVYQVKPYEMLTISFTNKAVRDIEQRYYVIRQRMGLPQYKPVFSTFHAFFRQLLLLYPEYEDTAIIRGSEYKFQLMDKVRDIGASLNTKSETVDNILNFRGYLINKGYSPDGLIRANQYVNLMKDFTFKDYKQVVTYYEELKKDNNQIDFDDLQGHVYTKLQDEQEKELIEDYFKRTFKLVLIDEYQDISPIQSNIMNHLVGLIGDDHLVAIGDDDQCIYSFRGSEPSIITNFEFEHTNAQRLFLSTNYRCPQNILSFVAPSISKNKLRVDKSLEVSSEGGEVFRINTEDTYDEFIKTIKEDYLHMKHKDDVAILVRDNAQRMLIADMLIRRGIPVDIQDKRWSLYNSSVYKRLIEIILGIKRSINETFVDRSWIFAPHLKKEIIQHYKYSEVLWIEDLQTERLTLAKDKTKTILKILAEQDMQTCFSLAFSLVDNHYQSGARKGFYNYETVRETYDYIYSIARGCQYTEFLERVQQIEVEISTYINQPKTIKIQTIHGVKGLEFKNVYLFNPTDRYFLRTQSSENPLLTMEEERRLFYVAVTRAKDKVTLVYDFNEEATFIEECLVGEELVRITPINETDKSIQLKESKQDKPNTARQLSLKGMKEMTNKESIEAWTEMAARVQPVKEEQVNQKKIRLSSIQDLLNS